MKIHKVYIGAWFQRTTLHLSEIHDFFKEAESPLELNKKKLNDLQRKLELRSVELKMGALDYIEAKSKKDIIFKIFEDGLIILSTNYDSLKQDIDELRDYYEKLLSPSLSYIFSLGAPIPKELANIKNIYPYFVVLKDSSQNEAYKLLKDFEQEKYFEINKDTFEIYRGNKLYIINNKGEKISNIEKLIQEQIFMREYKGQLHRYLNLHRIIWERIAEVKERGEIKGREIEAFKNKIEGYSKTINLIEARINQMGSYIGTRDSIIKSDQGFKQFADVLEFKYDTLNNTLSYIKDIWRMTKNYVNSSLDLFFTLQAKSTEASVKNLTVVTSMGVGATLIGLFTKKLPDFTLFGVFYFFLLILIGITANRLIKQIYARKLYKIREIKADRDIK